MTNIHIHRRVAIVGAAATVIITTAFAPAVSSTASERQDRPQDRPCFMIRSHWNNAEGPQPSCRIPMWQQQAPSSHGPGRPNHGHPTRGVDFMP